MRAETESFTEKERCLIREIDNGNPLLAIYHGRMSREEVYGLVSKLERLANSTVKAWLEYHGKSQEDDH